MVVFSLSVVITGTVTALSPAPQGRLLASVSIIKTYKDGGLTITQAGETMTVKLVLMCRTCPALRRGNLQQLDRRILSDKQTINVAKKKRPKQNN